MAAQTPTKPTPDNSAFVEKLRQTGSASGQDGQVQDSLTETIAQTGGQPDGGQFSQAQLIEAKRAQEEKQAVILGQHERIAGLNKTPIYDAREADALEQLKANRQEIALVIEEKGRKKDVELQKPLISQLTNVGSEGIGLKGYFHNLRVTIEDLIPRSEDQTFQIKDSKKRALQKRMGKTFNDLDGNGQNSNGQ